MNSRTPCIVLAALFALYGCGSDTETSNQNPAPIAFSPPANSNSAITSNGQISLPANDSTFNGNLLLAVTASSENGIAQVALKFAGGSQLQVLCDSNQDCGGDQYSQTISGVNPGNYGAQPGVVNIELQVTDSLQQIETVSTLTVNWQPPAINNVQATRSENGTEVTIRWENNPQLLRYNLYLASQTGVNIDTYQSLPEGQALLAVENGPQSFSNLSPSTNYFILLTGIDGSGESTNLNEITLPTDDFDPNNSPVANDDFETLLEDTTVSIDVLQNDSDPDGDTLTITAATAQAGTATLQGDQVFYEPPLNFNGNTLIDYTISDSNGGVSSAQVSIQVTAINDAPFAEDDSETLLEDTAVLFDVLQNDSDVDGDALTITAATAQDGTATLQAGQVFYEPPLNFNGSTSIDYTISDGNDGVSSAQVSIQIIAINDAPFAGDDFETIDEDTAVLINVLQNDSDVDGDALTITAAAAQTGTATIQAGGIFYEPPADFNGSTSIAYTISDGNDGTSSAQVFIDVTAINDAPFAEDDFETIDENTTVLINVLQNDSDADGDALTIIAAAAQTGTATIQADQVFYEPPANFNGSTSIDYTISDGNGGMSSAQIFIDVTAINDDPLAEDDFKTIDEDTTVLIDVLQNDSDPDGDTLTIAAATAQDGTASIQADQVFYEPPADFNGSTTIDYTISDGNGGTADAQVFIEVTAISDEPLAEDDFETIDEDTTVSIDVLQNDSDADGDTLTITAATVQTGTATIQTNQVFYEPPADFNGSTIIDYTMSDGNGGAASAQVFIEVTAINDAPIADEDFADTNQDSAVNIDVLANDSDVDGDALTIIGPTSLNTVIIEADNTLTYEPPTGFVGTDSFEYTISDPDGETASAIVNVDVGLVSRQPIANPEEYVALAGQTLNIDNTQGLLVNDADPDIDPISISLAPIQSPASGILELATDGSFTYAPNAGFTGADSFEYEVFADNGQSDTATVTLNVRAIPADLVGDSNSISGEFLYIGLGEFSPGTGRGSGLYRIGDCLQDANTLCSMLGSYTESSTSGNNPNQTGNYAFIQSYGGAGNSPVTAISTTPGGNSLSFDQIGDASFDLFLFPNDGGMLKAKYPEVPFANSLGFGAFIDTAQRCTGIPEGTVCNIGEVGLSPDSQLIAPLDRLSFNQSGVVLASDQNHSPQANLDTFNVTSDTVLTVNAPGILANDTDPDTPIIGDTLELLSQFSPDVGTVNAVGFDEYRQLVYFANNVNSNIFVHNRLGAAVVSYPVDALIIDNGDIEITSEAMVLGEVPLPQGTLLYINGDSGSPVIFAFDAATGQPLAQLEAENFAAGDLVGGAYNPQTQTLFLLQETQSSTGSPVIAEINPNDGRVLSQFSAAFDALDFDVDFGDLDVNNETGTLYVLSSSEGGILELNPDGAIVRELALPTDVFNPSGLAINQSGDRIWLSSTNGDVYELSYANQGVAPQLQASTIVTTENGQLVTGRDGSFIYTPNTGFVGEDVFTYQIIDRKGKNSLNNVRINVTD